jgi:hypothetical protein
VSVCESVCDCACECACVQPYTQPQPTSTRNNHAARGKMNTNLWPLLPDKVGKNKNDGAQIINLFN